MQTRKTASPSIIILFSFFAFVLSSCGSVKPVSNKVVMSPSEFAYRQPADKRQFIMLNDGSIIYGSDVGRWGLGALNKKVLSIDGKTIPYSEIRAFKNADGYFVKIDNATLAKRYVEGRINVYVIVAANHTSWVLLQKQNGPLEEVSSIDVLKNMLADCPKAYDMINHPPKTGPRVFKPSYRQIAIETYNNWGRGNNPVSALTCIRYDFGSR